MKSRLGSIAVGRVPKVIFFGMLLLSRFVAATEPIENDSIVESEITDSDREHWSLLPIVKAELPIVRQPEWARQPLDFFILAQLETAGLQPAEAATRPVLLRRLSFDVRGMPYHSSQPRSCG